MSKTKIIATLGPNAENYETLTEIAKYMDVARFNFSHGSYEEHAKKFQDLKKVSKELNKPIATMLDTKGPEIRTGELVDHQKVLLEEGKDFVLTSREMLGTKDKVCITYTELVNDIEKGAQILIDDGLIELTVVEKDSENIYCKVVNGGELGEKKGVNVPNVKINLPDLTDKDIADIEFGIKMGFDMIAASFVRNAGCIKQIKDILREHNSDMLVFAKIENTEGVNNLSEIIDEADGIMVARGDLGVEVDATKIPQIQKDIINMCNAKGKLVITATQMLDSMIRNVRPTRAEVTDVANAIYDGTDIVMLSGETANGAHPVEAIKMMRNICDTTEEYVNYNYRRQTLFQTESRKTVTNIVCKEATNCADQLNAKCLLVITSSGHTARILSKYKPMVPIYAFSTNEKLVRQMMSFFGVTPYLCGSESDNLIEYAIDKLKEEGKIASGDTVVIAQGKNYNPGFVKNHTNNIQVETIV